ncbi:hypothetical protein Zmor_019854 [Zophobas morio]|uniref:Ricin B lectin domain-containing protein n=1 Tax=Zophobas morio TaxID=2755281 RepID=A0AA38I2D6_9CUCU|nr:hypothetical protein Zmor_019854 [Zophobas morio]
MNITLSSSHKLCHHSTPYCLGSKNPPTRFLNRSYTGTTKTKYGSDMKHLYAQSLTLLLVGVGLISATSTCSDDDLYVIRSAASIGLVVDGTDHRQITVEPYTGFSTQLWRFKIGNRPGLYYIINNHTGHALDFIDRKVPVLVSTEPRDTLDQQWMVSMNGTIVNAAKLWNLDIHKAEYVAGNGLIVWENNGCECQRFTLQRKV